MGIAALALAVTATGAGCGGGGGASSGRAEATLTAAFPASTRWIDQAAVLEILPDTAHAVIIVRDLGRLHALLGEATGTGEHADAFAASLAARFGAALSSPDAMRAAGVAFDAPLAFALLPDKLVALALPVADEDAFANVFADVGDRVMLHGKTAIVIASLDDDRGEGFSLQDAAVEVHLTTSPERSLARASEVTAVIAQLQYAPDAIVYLPQRALRELVMGDIAESAADPPRPTYDEYDGYGYDDDDDESGAYGGDMYGGYDVEAPPSEETIEQWREEWRKWGVPLGGVAIGVGWTDDAVIAIEATGSIDDRGIGWATAKGVAMGAEALLMIASQRVTPGAPPADVESATAAEAKAAAAKAPKDPDPDAAKKQDVIAKLRGETKIIWAPSKLGPRHALAARLLSSGAPLAVYQLADTQTETISPLAVEAAAYAAKLFEGSDSEEVKALRGKRDKIHEARKAQLDAIARGLGVFVAAGSATDGVPRLRGGLFFDGLGRAALAKQLLHSWSRNRDESSESERLAELDAEIATQSYDSYGYDDEGYDEDYDYWGEEGGVEGGVVGGVLGGVEGGVVGGSIYDSEVYGIGGGGNAIGLGGGTPRYTAVPGVINIDGADSPSTMRAAVLSAITDIETSCTVGAATLSLSIAVVVDASHEDVTVKERGKTPASDVDAVRACISGAFTGQIDGAVESGTVKIRLNLELQ